MKIIFTSKKDLVYLVCVSVGVHVFLFQELFFLGVFLNPAQAACIDIIRLQLRYSCVKGCFALNLYFGHQTNIPVIYLLIL